MAYFLPPSLIMARITKTEKQEIQKLRKAYIAKRSRLVKRGVSERFIPQIPLITPDMPRAQVNAIKAEIRSFTSRYNQNFQFVQLNDTLTVPKTLVSQLKREQAIANRRAMQAYRRNLKLPFIPLSERGWAAPGAHRTVESERRKEKPRGYKKKPEEFKTAQQLEDYIVHLQKHNERTITDWDEQWRENTIKAIIDTYGETNAAKLIAKVRQMPISDFIFLMETQDVDIPWIYDSILLDTGWEKLNSYFDLPSHKKRIYSQLAGD